MEATDFYREIVRRLAAGERLALATVVQTRGSAPREAGAKMAVTAAGSVIGTIGGGDPEHRATRAALAAIAEGKPAMLHVELTAEATANAGATCGGTMDVFVEPLKAALAPERRAGATP